MARAEAPLRLELGRRNCRRFWLVMGHLLALLALVMALELGWWLILVMPFWVLSVWRHWRHEALGSHPRALLWSTEEGWRLDYSTEIRPIGTPGLLRLGQCQLIDTGEELFFLPPLVGSQRLRLLLLQG